MPDCWPGHSKFTLGAFMCAALAACSVVAHGQVLLTDSFRLTSPTPDSTNLNFDLAGRQGGLLSPITYSKGGEPIFSQVGNGVTPNALLLACRSAGTSGSASLDYNFGQMPGQFDKMVIQFDVNPVIINPAFNTTETSWVCIDFGSSAVGRDQFPQSTDGVGLLFRGNGQTQAFDNAAIIPSTNFAPTADHQFHHIRIEIEDPGGGNPFVYGAPALVQAYADATSSPFLSFDRPHGFFSDYLSFVGEGEGGGGDGVVRHLVTDLQIGTERQLAGDANDDGRVTFSDLLTLAQHFGAGRHAMPAEGDFNNDGSVGFDDLLLLAQNYGKSLPGATVEAAFAGGFTSVAGIPEPSSLFLVIAYTAIRRRHS